MYIVWTLSFLLFFITQLHEHLRKGKRDVHYYAEMTGHGTQKHVTL